jgi:SAM-dependent methyltransferase/uncharacterized protein YbaR (Trm112 family)
LRESLLEHLACPACSGELCVRHAQVADGQIERGALHCGCGRRFPIEHGVPNFVEPGGSGPVARTTDGFQRNWDAFNDVILSNEALNDELFRDWIAPCDPAEFEGQVVLEPGCGMGRWLRVAAKYRPRVLIGVDYSSVAYTAARNVRHLDNVHVIRGDLLHLPLKRRIESIYCLGVVHHTPEPERSFDALVQALAPGGQINCWVYGAENNGWITDFISPLREHVTSKLPHALLGVISAGLCLPLLAAAVAAAIPGFPYRDYLRYLKRYPFRYMCHIVYDHLVPEISHYLRRGELESWARTRGLPFELSSRNGNSWRLLARRPAAMALERALTP